MAEEMSATQYTAAPLGDSVALSHENEVLSQRNKDLRQENEDLRRELGRLNMKYRYSRNTKKKTLQRQNEMFRAEAENVRRTTDTLRCEISVMLSAKQATLIEREAMLSEKDREIDDLHKQCDFGEIEKQSLLQKIGALEEEVAEKNPEEAANKRHNLRMENKVQELVSVLEDFRVLVTELKESLQQKTEDAGKENGDNKERVRFLRREACLSPTGFLHQPVENINKATEAKQTWTDWIYHWMS